MTAMPSGLVATASLNWVIIVDGSQSDQTYCTVGPRASSAALAPLATTVSKGPPCGAAREEDDVGALAELALSWAATAPPVTATAETVSASAVPSASERRDLVLFHPHRSSFPTGTRRAPYGLPGPRGQVTSRPTMLPRGPLGRCYSDCSSGTVGMSFAARLRSACKRVYAHVCCASNRVVSAALRARRRLRRSAEAWRAGDVAPGIGQAQAGRGRAPGMPAAPTAAPTMRDIALVTGVSQSTVSRVLSGTPTAVPIAAATRLRVTEAAARMGYRPNPLARGLRGAPTMLLGVIVRDVTDPFFAGAIEAASLEANRRGYNVVLGHAHQSADEAVALWGILEARHCDALLFLGDLRDRPGLVEDLQNTSIPVVAMWHGSRESGIPTVERRQSGRHGRHRRSPRRTGPSSASPSPGPADSATSPSARRPTGPRSSGTGWRGAGSTSRMPATTSRAAPRPSTCCMDLDEPPTAIVAPTDVLAIGMLHAAQRRGLRVPADVSISGFDDIPVAAVSVPALTTVRMPTEAMIAAALDLVIGPVSAGADGHPVLQPELVVRASTGPVPSRRQTRSMTMPSYVVGVDFGTESGRAVLVDVGRRRGRSAAASTPTPTASSTSTCRRPTATSAWSRTGRCRTPTTTSTFKQAIPAVLAPGRRRPGRRDRRRHRLHRLHDAADQGGRHAALLPARVAPRAARLGEAVEAPRRPAGGRPHQRDRPRARRGLAGPLRRQDLLRVVLPKALQILDEAPEIYAAADRLIEAADWVVWQLTGRGDAQHLHGRLQGHLVQAGRLPGERLLRGARPAPGRHRRREDVARRSAHRRARPAG